MRDMPMKFLFILFLCSLQICCEGQDTSGPILCSRLNFCGYRLMIGPEAVHVKRGRKGGSEQSSWLPGGRCIIEHYRRYCFYWGVEGAYAKGTLRGHTRLHNRLKSTMSDGSIEGRFGYTFKGKYCWQPAITPFVGIGYVWEKNNVSVPSQMPIHFRTKYKYATAGFLAAISPMENLTIGLNGKLRYFLDPRCRISNDPDFSSSTLKVGNDQFSYRIELPLSYSIYPPTWGITFMPFCERRIYGGMAAYPHDYLRTDLFYYGASLMLSGCF